MEEEVENEVGLAGEEERENRGARRSRRGGGGRRFYVRSDHKNVRINGYVSSWSCSQRYRHRHHQELAVQEVLQLHQLIHDQG